MPEGHLLHHYARRMDAAWRGERLVAASPQGRLDVSSIDGGVAEAVEAHGKHLFVHFDGGRVVHVHLGKQGVYLLGDVPAPPPRRQVRLRLTGGTLNADLIAPLQCRILDEDGRDEVVAKLGPDPLRADADPEQVRAAIASSSRPIGALLLDQSVVAGVGNVLRAEVLALERMDPGMPGRDLSPYGFERLWSALSWLMEVSARDGRILPLAGEDPEERATVDEAETRLVYRQAHCRRCGTGVQVWQLDGRTAYACPNCQPPVDNSLRPEPTVGPSA